MSARIRGQYSFSKSSDRQQSLGFFDSRSKPGRVALSLYAVYYAIEFKVINRLSGPDWFRSLDRVLKQHSRPVGLPDGLRLPEGVLMLANPSVEDGTRGVEQNPSPELLLFEYGEVLCDIDPTSGPERLVAHPKHAFDEISFSRVLAGTAADLDRHVDELGELHVVQGDVLL
jgi:hypothetical protein